MFSDFKAAFLGPWSRCHACIHAGILTDAEKVRLFRPGVVFVELPKAIRVHSPSPAADLLHRHPAEEALEAWVAAFVDYIAKRRSMGNALRSVVESERQIRPGAIDADK